MTDSGVVKTSDINIDQLAENYSTRTLNNKSIEHTQTAVHIEKMNEELMNSIRSKDAQIDPKYDRYPYSIVWTPLPFITWFLPFIGHMGICTSTGIIRDFAGPYQVSENNMSFGRPTRYWQLNVDKIPNVANKRECWDRSVKEASDEYKKRMHNLCCDNCHSHVAYALNLMNYDNSSSWNMVKLCFLFLIKGSFVSFSGFLKTWLPFLILSTIVVIIVLTTNFTVNKI